MFAASDTSSNALARILHLLALHVEVQETLRQEVFTFREAEKELTYDRLMELPFLDAVCKETFRAYVSEYPDPFLSRFLIILHIATHPLCHLTDGAPIPLPGFIM